MNHIYPDYYTKFRCIASSCRHNCCIGWEIDIDEDTLSIYKSIEGDFKERFEKNISLDETPHFILKENDRCPFLNDRNLCDIITEFGEGHLCHICTEHPRFHTELPQRVESGLGLSCEEAARLILTKKSKTVLLGNKDTDDEIILFRDKIIEAFQNRDLHIEERIENILSIMETEEYPFDRQDAKDFFLSLERLDPLWEETLSLLDIAPCSENEEEGKELLKEKPYLFEQFAVYLIYRHTASAPTLFDSAIRVLFAIYSLRLITALSKGLYIKNGDFTDEDFVELSRQFSSEIEYSDENLYEIFDRIENKFQEELL